MSKIHTLIEKLTFHSSKVLMLILFLLLITPPPLYHFIFISHCPTNSLSLNSLYHYYTSFPQESSSVFVFTVLLSFFLCIINVAKSFWDSSSSNKLIITTFVFLYCLGSILSIYKASLIIGNFNDFLNSFIASFWEDFLILGTIGILLYYLQSREYSINKSLESKVKDLFNSQELSPSAFDYLRSKVREAAVYHKSDETLIIIKSVEKKTGYINCCSIRTFRVSTLITTKIPDYHGIYKPMIHFTPDKNLDKISPGNLCYLRYWEEDAEGNQIGSKIYLIEDVKIKKGVSISYPEGELGEVSIKPERIVVFEQKIDYWSNPGEPDTSKFVRYWNNVNVSLTNDTNDSIVVKVEGPNSDKSTIEVNVHDREKVLWKADNIIKDDVFTLRHIQIGKDKIKQVKK